MHLLQLKLLKPFVSRTTTQCNFRILPTTFRRNIIDVPPWPRPRYPNHVKNPEHLNPTTLLRLDYDRYPWWAIPKTKPNQIEKNVDATNIATMLNDDYFIPKTDELLAWIDDYNFYFSKGDYEGARRIALDAGRKISQTVTNSSSILKPWYKKLERFHLLVADCIGHCFIRQGKFDDAYITLSKVEKHLSTLTGQKSYNALRLRWDIALGTSLVNLTNPNPMTNALARKYANSIIRTDPKCVAGHLIKFQILLRSNHRDPNYQWEDHEKKVFAMFEVLESIMPKFEANLWKAFGYRELGRNAKLLGIVDGVGYYLKAAELYEELVKQEPDNFDVKRNAILCWYGTEEVQNAMRCFDQFYEEESTQNKLILLRDKATFFCDSDYSGDFSLEAAEKGLELDPGNKYFLLKKGESLLMIDENGSWERGLEVLKEVVKDPKPEDTVYVVKAYHALALSYKDDPIALTYYNEIFKYDAPYNSLVAKGHYLLRNSREYEEIFEVFLQAWEQRVTLWGGFGLLLAATRLEKWDLCVEILENMYEMMQLKDTTAINRYLADDLKEQAYHYQTNMYPIRKWNEEWPPLSKEIYEEATEVDRAWDMAACMVRGLYYDVDEAFDYAIEAGYDKNPFFYLCRSYISYIRCESNPSDSTEYAEKCLQYAPEVTSSYYHLGAVYRQTDRLADAVDVYQKGVLKFPADAVMWAYLGHTYALQKMYFEAERAYKQALSFEPNNYIWMRLYAEALQAMGRTQEAKKMTDEAVIWSFWGNDERNFPRRDPRILNPRSNQEHQKFEKEMIETV